MAIHMDSGGDRARGPGPELSCQTPCYMRGCTQNTDADGSTSSRLGEGNPEEQVSHFWQDLQMTLS